jgi:SWI/SNF-related matrix-associated actin-dependent regulator 1 of chromatin subfamily A
LTNVQFGSDRRGRPTFVLSFAYDARLVDAVRRLPDRRFEWDAREWVVPRRPDTALALDGLLARHAALTPGEEVENWLEEGRRWWAQVTGGPGAVLDDGFELTVGSRPDLAAEFRGLPEVEVVRRRGDGFLAPEQRDVLGLPADPALLDDLDDFLDRNDDAVDVTPAAHERIAALRRERRRAKATVALSLADDADLGLGQLGGDLRPFQRAGVAYALRQRRTFLADEQGLGKTVQALAAIEAAGAYPAVVVCPASLKLAWQREAARWLPHRATTVVQGRRGPVADADITILNYEIVAHHLDSLLPRAVVFDESHYCKDPRAQRTKACLALVERLPPDALRLALTGTPVLNRPKELVAQLRLIGRLGDVAGSGAALTRRYGAPAAHERLHWKLRAHCYVRRLKADVLPQLPPKRQVTVPVELSNAAEYRLAERDLVAWLRRQPLDLGTLKARIAAARRSERLVRLNHLRRLAARGKLSAALAWIDDFLASGEPLVVFADHVEVQRAVLARHPGAARVLGADDAHARDRAVAAFGRPDGPRLIVCSLRAAGHGLTLTRASNVAFLELDWTPARLAQAEDRCHRIGQHDAVTAWYLVAPGTIDDTMAGLLEQKRGLIGAVTDGRADDEDSIVEAVVRDLRDAA